MNQKLSCDEIEMWHGHPDLYMNKLVEILYTLDNSDSGYFVEVDFKYPNEKKMINFPFRPENEVSRKDEFAKYMNNIKPDVNIKKVNLRLE